MKAITIREPWASLIAEGHKWIETRDWRCTSLIGQTVGIHAGRTLYTARDKAENPELWHAVHEALQLERNRGVYCLPYGRIVATARVTGCARIGGPTSFSTGLREGSADPDEVPYIDQDVIVYEAGYSGGTTRAAAPSLVLSRADTSSVDISDQLPWGDWTAGRWGWLLADIRKLDEPIEARGLPGIWTIPPEAEEKLAA